MPQFKSLFLLKNRKEKSIFGGKKVKCSEKVKKGGRVFFAAVEERESGRK